MKKPLSLVEIEFKDIPEYLTKGYVIVQEGIVTKRFYYRYGSFIVEYDGKDISVITQGWTIINNKDDSYGAFKREEFDDVLKSLI